VGNSAADSRVVRAAYSGDVLDLYMIGLGATADPSGFVTDRVFSGAFPVSAPVTATVGGASAPVLFAGLTSPGPLPGADGRAIGSGCRTAADAGIGGRCTDPFPGAHGGDRPDASGPERQLRFLKHRQ